MMFPSLNKPSVNISKISDSTTREAGINLYVQREDLLHPVISGNKWYKLKWNLLLAKQQNHNTLLSFGGAYSNHIHALSFAGKQFGFNTIGLIRGEELAGLSFDELSPTLKDAIQNGMKLVFISRKDYRLKEKKQFLEQLHSRFGRFYCIPEGGNNIPGVIGCADMLRHLVNPDSSENDQIIPDWICMACGTGCTLAGLTYGVYQHSINKDSSETRLLGISVLKGAEFLEQNVQDQLSCLLPESELESFKNYWSLNYQYHFGGYGKITATLLDFINNFKQQNGIALEAIYTGKLFYGVYDLIKSGYFPKDSNIVLIHSGGLQGARAPVL